MTNLRLRTFLPQLPRLRNQRFSPSFRNRVHNSVSRVSEGERRWKGFASGEYADLRYGTIILLL
jgi:hypothetical protein